MAEVGAGGAMTSWREASASTAAVTSPLKHRSGSQLALNPAMGFGYRNFNSLLACSGTAVDGMRPRRADRRGEKRGMLLPGKCTRVVS